MTKVKITRGDTAGLKVTVTNKVTGVIFNLTGYTMRLTVKKSPSQPDSEALIGPVTCTIDTPASGIGIANLSTSDTDVEGGVWWYDVQISDGTNNYTVQEPIKDFTVIDDITKINTV